MTTNLTDKRRIFNWSILFGGQAISLLGSLIAGFGISIWVYQLTGSALDYALLNICSLTPRIVVSPFAGAFVDRWNRRAVLLITDTISALTTVFIFLMLQLGAVQLWHIYLATAISSFCLAFQSPAYSTVSTLTMPKSHYDRLGAISSLVIGILRISYPALAGIIFAAYDMPGLVLTDLLTYGIALISTVLLFIPKVEESEEGKTSKGNLLQEATFGMRYIAQRRGLLELLLLYTLNNFLQGLVLVLFIPMVLSFATSQELGVTVSLGVSGNLLAALIMFAIKTPKRRIPFILLAQFGMGLSMVLGGLKPSLFLITLGGFLYWVSFRFYDNYQYTLWRLKVPADIQGRIWSTQTFIAWSVLPIAFLLAAPIADSLTGPAFMPGGAADGTILSSLFELGPGRGIGFMFTSAGILTLIIGVWAALSPYIRNIETDLPDAIPSAKSEVAEEADPELVPSPEPSSIGS